MSLILAAFSHLAFAFSPQRAKVAVKRPINADSDELCICPRCDGMGYDDEGNTCPECEGTGETWCDDATDSP